MTRQTCNRASLHHTGFRPVCQLHDPMWPSKHGLLLLTIIAVRPQILADLHLGSSHETGNSTRHCACSNTVSFTLHPCCAGSTTSAACSLCQAGSYSTGSGDACMWRPGSLLHSGHTCYVTSDGGHWCLGLQHPTFNCCLLVSFSPPLSSAYFNHSILTTSGLNRGSA